MKKWEYTLLYSRYRYSGSDRPQSSTIKEYGLQGWELVSACPLAWVSGPIAEILFTFKRPIE